MSMPEDHPVQEYLHDILTVLDHMAEDLRAIRNAVEARDDR